MSRRTHIMLTDEHHARLRRISDQTGMSMSELIRRALDRAYAGGRAGNPCRGFGLWADRTFDSREYVERLRRPGLGTRLRQLTDASESVSG